MRRPKKAALSLSVGKSQFATMRARLARPAGAARAFACRPTLAAVFHGDTIESAVDVLAAPRPRRLPAGLAVVLPAHFS